MGLPTAYLVTAKNLEGIINSLISAKAPERLTGSFLKTLGYTSSNDTLYVKLFKEIGLLDSNGTPTEKYYRFIDQSQTAKVLAECVEEGYSDLFAINQKAYEMTEEEVKNKLKTLTQGSIEDNKLKLMAKTFKALADYADWKKPAQQKKSSPQTYVPHNSQASKKEETETKINSLGSGISSTLHYNIQIHLPETRDASVYDAIFKSLKEHLM